MVYSTTNNPEKHTQSNFLGQISIQEDKEIVSKKESVDENRKRLVRVAVHQLRKTQIAETKTSALLDCQTEDPSVYKKNIEKFVGTLKIPIGLAGPVLINGQFARGEYYIPMATTEGALVASYNRGCKAIRMSGGATTRVVAEGVSRAPAFVFENLIQAEKFLTWVNRQFDYFKEIGESTTRYGKLKQIEPHHEGNRVFLCFYYTTGNAAGQNMVTIATEAIFNYILEHSPVAIRSAYLETNFSSDKKASYNTLLKVRGRKVCAEVNIPAKICQRLLHTTVDKIVELWDLSRHVSALTGTIGNAAHYGNGLAALYLATGQDVACVAESANGITRMEKTEDNNLYLSVTMPNIIVGTVGGGTELPSQRAGLEILGIGYGANSASALAEITATVCMAGELSLISAIASGHFTSAHKRHGR